MTRRPWIVVGAVPLALALAVGIRPDALGSAPFFNLYNLAMVASVAALVFGVCHWRPKPLWPWVMIALTIVLWVSGDLVYGAYSSPPTVSVADVFYIAGYVTVIVGVLRLVRVGIGQQTTDSVLDMLIVGVAAVYASWALVIEPTWGRSDVSYGARLILVSYPVMDAALLVLLAQLALGRRPTVSNMFLALGMLIVFAGDIGFAVLQQTNSFVTWSILDASWPLGYAVVALAALHPSVRMQRERPRGEEQLLDPRRLLVSFLAVLSVPSVVVIAHSISGELGRVALMSASIALFVLVSWRTLRLHHQAESAQAALGRSGQYFRGLAINSSDAYGVIADNGIVTDSAPQLERVIGWTQRDTVGKSIAVLIQDLVHPDDAARATAFLERARRAKRGRSAEVELRLRRPDGSFRWVEAYATNLLDDPAVSGIVLNMHDIDKRKHAEEGAERERTRLEQAQRVAGVGSFEQDLTDPKVYPSPELCRIIGIPVVPHFAVARLIEAVHPDDRLSVGTAIQANIETGTPVDLEHRVVRPDGTERWVHVRVEARTVGDGRMHRVIGTVLDITDRIRTETDLAYQGLHDTLTGLANRTLFLDRLDHALRQAERGTDPIAVLLLDVDDFKAVNDALGHAAGDRLLCILAERLALVTRAGDTIARLGGDEFAVLLGSGVMPRTAETIARRIAGQLTSPFRVGGTEVTVSVSVGITVAQPSRAASEDLLRDADLAMYLAKQHGKGRFELARPHMQDEALRHLGVVTDLRHAQANGELEVFYQTIVAVGDATPAGAEALIRWNHPSRGLVFPLEFISEAESTGLIVPIGDWILNEACRQTQAWRRAGTVDDDFYISVNLSPRQLREANLIDRISGALRASGLPPRALVLEITESTLMVDFDAALARVRSLKDLGLRIALDDYGTGYSSLNRLAKLPVDIVKIDKSFIDQLDVDEVGRALVQSIIDVAKTLSMKTIAEGVERPDQRVALEEIGCDYIQGYLFATPTPPLQTAALLRRLALPAEHPNPSSGRVAAATVPAK